MDVNLENLIERIKTEAVQKARSDSDEITATAKEEAALIIAKAESEAEGILNTARQESDKLKVNSEAALQQAGRDLVLVLKEKIKALFDRTLGIAVSEALDSDLIKDLIIRMVSDVKDKKSEVLVNESDIEPLKKVLFASLKKELKDSVVFKVDNRVKKGFRIGIDGENAYSDFTDESIMNALAQFLSPAINKILNQTDE